MEKKTNCEFERHLKTLERFIDFKQMLVGGEQLSLDTCRARYLSADLFVDFSRQHRPRLDD
jgi:hypothetical protein